MHPDKCALFGLVLRRQAGGLLCTQVTGRVLVSPIAELDFWLTSLHVASPSACWQIVLILMLPFWRPVYSGASVQFAILGGILLSRFNPTQLEA